MSKVHATSDARERLAEAVERMADSETFAAWLRARATFHDYSFGNVCLIVSQRPDATQVAGYKAWQKLGRQVRKGEHGIRILAPCRVKVAETIRRTTRRVPRRAVSGASRCSMSHRPTESRSRSLEYRPLEGDAPADMVDLLAKVAANAGLRVEYRHARDRGRARLLAAFRVADRRRSGPVAGDAREGARARARPLLRPVARSKHPELYAAHRGDCEAVAESVAYVVAARFGLDAGRVRDRLRRRVDRRRRRTRARPRRTHRRSSRRDPRPQRR